jgi:hypothetical protein
MNTLPRTMHPNHDTKSSAKPLWSPQERQASSFSMNHGMHELQAHMPHALCYSIVVASSLVAAEERF